MILIVLLLNRTLFTSSFHFFLLFKDVFIIHFYTFCSVLRICEWCKKCTQVSNSRWCSLRVVSCNYCIVMKCNFNFSSYTFFVSQCVFFITCSYRILFVYIFFASVNIWESEVACGRVKQSFCNVVWFPLISILVCR